MPKYYVNKNAQANGDHEVHKTSCNFGANEENRVDLGTHTDCKGAVKKAKEKGYENVDGCAHCCPDCHTS